MPNRARAAASAGGGSSPEVKTARAVPLTALAAELDAGVLPPGARDRAYNLCWHDWLNLGNLIAVSRAIVRAAQARENSCGAHFRADFPEAGDPAASVYTRIVQSGNALRCEQIPVRFTRVRPGESLLPA